MSLGKSSPRQPASQQHMFQRIMGYPRIFEADPVVHQLQLIQKGMTLSLEDAIHCNKHVYACITSLQKQLKESEENRRTAHNALALSRVKESAVQELLKKALEGNLVEMEGLKMKFEEERQTALGNVNQARAEVLQLVDQNFLLTNTVKELQSELAACKAAGKIEQASHLESNAAAWEENLDLRSKVRHLENQLLQLKEAYIMSSADHLNTQVELQVLRDMGVAFQTSAGGLLAVEHNQGPLLPLSEPRNMEAEGPSTLGLDWSRFPANAEPSESSSVAEVQSAAMDLLLTGHSADEGLRGLDDPVDEGCDELLRTPRSSFLRVSEEGPLRYRVSVTTTLYWLIC